MSAWTWLQLLYWLGVLFMLAIGFIWWRDRSTFERDNGQVRWLALRALVAIGTAYLWPIAVPICAVLARGDIPKANIRSREEDR